VRFTVDDRVVALEGGELRDLEPGIRRVLVNHEDYETGSGSVEVTDGGVATWAVALVPKPGRLSLSSTPPGATVRGLGDAMKDVSFTDSQNNERLTPFEAMLPPGDYTLSFSLAGHQSATRTVKVAANRTQALSVPLTKQRGPKPGQVWKIPELGLELLPIEPGNFVMGSKTGEADEKPLTAVQISRPYWLGKYEVTQREWAALMKGNPSHFKETGQLAPVEQVSWDDAMEYCRRLTEREQVAGRLLEGYIYTLPTEAQWEYACRAGTTKDFAGTEKLEDMGWYERNSGGKTQGVGQKQANAWGLHDMHGNVWEWCRDGYADKLPGGSVIDPKGAKASVNNVFRGGSWKNAAINCRASDRCWLTPEYSSDYLGFRVALCPAP